MEGYRETCDQKGTVPKAECAHITKMMCELDWGKRLRAISHEGASVLVPKCDRIGVKMKDMVASQVIRQLQLLQRVVHSWKESIQAEK